ncbi:hypothetical protein LSCM1_07603 [Leishmania martiniquensis]|uniref:Dynein heavy chain, cytosolic n=1 Tax=Leishmania martiniquensis TaxID=1580590 RepID=A0A836GP30_9TRYP|nr:hypothetical protein LSCM1_07603 [Leishmania martiniquensis]
MDRVATASPELMVGAIVAYECLLDKAAGTTTWWVGSILALPSSPSADDTVEGGFTAPPGQSDTPMQGERKSVESASQKTSRAGSGCRDDKVRGTSATVTRARMPASACQAVLIQPWVSLASVADVHGDAVDTKPSGAAARAPATAAGDGTSHRPSPSPHRRTTTSATRLAKIKAIQEELEEIQRFTSGDGDVTDGERDRRLAAALSKACTRVLVIASPSRACGTNEADDYSELAQKIERKRVELCELVECILSEMKTTRYRERELQEAHKTLRVSIEDAKKQLREAQEKVQHIDKRHLREIQGYRLPPAGVKLVMDAVFCVLSEATTSWNDMVAIMRSPSFISKIVSYDHARLTPAAVRKLQENFISNRRFSHADALKVSRALGPLQEWVMRQTQLAEAHRAHAAFVAEKGESGGKPVAARKKIEADAAALRDLEQDLETFMREQARRLQTHRVGTLSVDPSGGDAPPQGRSSPLTGVLASATESRKEATASPQRPCRPSACSSTCAESPTSAPAAVASNSAEATASNNATERVYGDGVAVADRPPGA